MERQLSQVVTAVLADGRKKGQGNRQGAGKELPFWQLYFGPLHHTRSRTYRQVRALIAAGSGQGKLRMGAPIGLLAWLRRLRFQLIVHLLAAMRGVDGLKSSSV